MLSICLSSRIINNPSSNLKRFLDSLDNFTKNDEKDKIEILIKFDNDDIIPEFVLNSEYPFPIKYFQYERGEGRWDIANVLNFLITMVDEKCKFIMNIADDFVIDKYFLTDLLKIDEYSIIGGASWAHPYGKEYDPGKRNLYMKPPLGVDPRNIDHWGYSIGAYAPIFGRKLMLSTGCNVLINSVDFYFVSLALEIYNKHGLNIWKDFHNFYDRIESYNASRKKCYNLLDYPANDGGFLSSEYERRYFEIVSSQATNIYLNMKNQNVGT